MIAGAFGYRVPPDGWSPEGWTSPATQKAMITANHVALKHAHKAPQFWLIWAVLCLNVSAGIGIIGAASPMLQETFGGALIHDPSTGFTQFSDARKTLAAAIGGGFVGLFSLFNIGDRFRFDRPQNDLFCLLRARRDLLRRRAHSRWHQGGRGFRRRILHHRLDVTAADSLPYRPISRIFSARGMSAPFMAVCSPHGRRRGSSVRRSSITCMTRVWRKAFRVTMSMTRSFMFLPASSSPVSFAMR